MAPKCSNVLVAFLLLFLIQGFLVQPRILKSEKQYFESLQNLEGVQKGQTVKGLWEVKQYLKNFGYLPSYTNVTNEFDGLLESALKTYQKNYHLNVTGSLDSDTIKEMMIPRCGMPDIINQPPPPPSKHGHWSSKFHMVSHYSFFNGMPRWPPSKYDLTYSFRSGVKVIDLQELRSICSRAFRKWANVSPFTFSEAPAGAQSDIVIGFYRGDHGDGSSFDGPGRILAHAFRPQDGRLHYDADEDWSTSPTMNQIDLESVAVHEMGHVLGLGHSQDPNAIMYAAIPAGIVKRNLNRDDINGIRALYPN